MRYHNITKDDMLNGDGLRAVLWLAGCEHHCKGCQNPITWDPEGGIEFDEAAKAELSAGQIVSSFGKLNYLLLYSGGPDGEIGASMRYLSQRFTAPNRMVAAVLNDVGTEELAHLEIVSTIVHQLTKDLSMEEIENSGLGPYYIDHTVGIWPQAAGGVPFNACEFQSKGDPITDLFEDLAAEQKARSTYDNILRVVKNIPEVADPIRFLRAREVVHFQRFGEALRSVQEQLDAKNFYAFNPSFDAPCKASCEE